MKADAGGEAGFMEAVLAMMVVTVALSAFLGLLAAWHADEAEPAPPDVGFLGLLAVEDGEVAGDIDEEVGREMLRLGLAKVRVAVSVAGCDAEPFEFEKGEGGADASSVAGTFRIRSDDGRRLTAAYEVVYWRRGATTGGWRRWSTRWCSWPCSRWSAPGSSRSPPRTGSGRSRRTPPTACSRWS